MSLKCTKGVEKAQHVDNDFDGGFDICHRRYFVNDDNCSSF